MKDVREAFTLTPKGLHFYNRRAARRRSRSAPTRSVPDWTWVAPYQLFGKQSLVLLPVRLRTRARRIVFAPVGRLNSPGKDGLDFGERGWLRCP